jgi:Cu/Ag efflux protein CusF
MRTLITTLGIAVASAMAPLAAAQTGAAVVDKAPGRATAAQTVKVTATITAIDAATRTVTLKGPEGKEVAINAGPEVKNFAQLKVGDQVNVQYLEALTLELKKGGTGMAPSRVEKSGAGAAQPGAKPGAAAGRQVVVIADVVDLNAEKQTVTLKGPQRTVELKVNDPAQFKDIKKGDQVQATYTEALAVSVEPAAAKK